MIKNRQHVKLCFNPTTDLIENREFKRILTNPKIIPDNEDYEIKLSYYTGVNLFIQFDAGIYFNDVKVLNFGMKIDEGFRLYNHSTENKLPKTIKDIKILFNWINWDPVLMPKLFPSIFKYFKVDFYFKEKLSLWVENDIKEECVICYENTTFSTRCLPKKHYICIECFKKCLERKTICPLCNQKLRDKDEDIFDISFLFNNN
jgi:hypothetical protein